MIKIMLIKNGLTKDEKDFFEKMNPGFSVTGGRIMFGVR